MPVLGGIVLFAAMGAITWGIAVYISSGGSQTSERLARSTFEIGNVERLAETVADDGPLLFPELGTAIGTRSIVVDHTGAAPADGWRVYWGYPADRPAGREEATRGVGHDDGIRPGQAVGAGTCATHSATTARPAVVEPSLSDTSTRCPSAATASAATSSGTT